MIFEKDHESSAFLDGVTNAFLGESSTVLVSVLVLGVLLISVILGVVLVSVFVVMSCLVGVPVISPLREPRYGESDDDDDNGDFILSILSSRTSIELYIDDDVLVSMV